MSPEVTENTIYWESSASPFPPTPSFDNCVVLMDIVDLPLVVIFTLNRNLVGRVYC